MTTLSPQPYLLHARIVMRDPATGQESTFIYDGRLRRLYDDQEQLLGVTEVDVMAFLDQHRQALHAESEVVYARRPRSEHWFGARRMRSFRDLTQLAKAAWRNEFGFGVAAPTATRALEVVRSVHREVEARMADAATHSPWTIAYTDLHGATCVLPGSYAGFSLTTSSAVRSADTVAYLDRLWAANGGVVR